MTTAPPKAPTSSPVASDRLDERLQSREGLGGWVQSWVDRFRGGDLGLLPVIIGIVVIWTTFQVLNPVFLSSANLVNLTLESVSTGVIALGIVFVLLLGQIDLSVGSVSGLSAASVATLFVLKGFPAVVSIAAALALGIVVGLVYTVMFNRFGVPSFVITLAGLLAFLGVQLWMLGEQGSVNLPFDSGLVRFAQVSFMPDAVSYVLVVVAATAVFVTGYLTARTRRAAGLSAPSLQGLAARSAVLLVGLGFAAWYLNRDRGIGWMFAMFLALIVVSNYLLTRTQWGRSIFAVGGNAEAARRSGINVGRVYGWGFVVCSVLAALGGVLAAARLGSATPATGTGDVNLNAIAAAVIGGTSLFGGRGSAWAALVGIIVITSITSGLTLLDLSSGYRFMVTGAVLLLAVALDSVARRSRASHGKG
ncbi:sugar ABC transporter permease [Terracoccus luteus]|jgi:D-xylose transport system permease protein|uniref:Xylose transport system permease protein XylH n=1 Tax=Terracoccus luteus TaxID=53356 RepID=A0A495XVW5_9MICO|nr:sugar ABC transporter permease [Terracoccus luteus]MBB2988060.1 simple sugar transport system permease protein/D-xylose transport system permease protein [Terracoccus luteus]MCP2173711.1 simple sugar transport system permease protein/D-xylose transport system permease protein [Terracoccus luteus]RKT76613.1 simple sugar transport system permease protein/D-xylose transport system permease protein [Terracoccus luteus]